MFVTAAYSQQQTNLRRISISELGKPGIGNNLYIYDTYLDKFVGTWIGNKDGKQMKIVLSKIAYKLSTDTANATQIEIITGHLQYTSNEASIASYDLKASIGGNNHILNVFITIEVRKAQATLSAYTYRMAR